MGWVGRGLPFPSREMENGDGWRRDLTNHWRARRYAEAREWVGGLVRVTVHRVRGCCDEHLCGTLRREPQLPRVLRGRLHLLGCVLLLGGGRTSGRRYHNTGWIISSWICVALTFIWMPNSHLPKQNLADCALAKIEVYPTQVREGMAHPVHVGRR